MIWEPIVIALGISFISAYLGYRVGFVKGAAATAMILKRAMSEQMLKEIVILLEKQAAEDLKVHD